MLDAVFQHRRTLPNVGDLNCSPGQWFDFGATRTTDFGEDAPPCRLAILGGGQVWGDCVDAVIYRTAQARHRVIWGVGIGRKDVRDIGFDVVSAGCALIGSRNKGTPRCDFVPCASAMSPLFDQYAAQDPLHDAVLFAHARKSGNVARIAGMPEMTNHDASLEATLAFLASAETVVTNSYHGTYWAMCLGRRVLCLPFSAKFRHFAENPPFADPTDWYAHLHLAERRPDTLDHARARNRAFYEKARNL